MAMSQETSRFFNELSTEYDALINRSVPRYQEMFWAMLYYLPPDFQPVTILELGCGTGNLSRILADRFPQARLTLVDIAEEMLSMTAEKLNLPERLQLVESAFETLDFPAGQFDLVISSIAVHHIQDEAKARLIRQIGAWLRPGGFFVLGDQVRGATERLYQADVSYYEHYAAQSGASEADVAQWRTHRETMDHYATLDNLTTWMRSAGLQHVDVLWRYCFWSVLQGQKPV